MLPFSISIYNIHDGNPDTALDKLAAAEARFDAERLVDGLVSTSTVRLTALRQSRDDGGWTRERRRLLRLVSGEVGGVYYARENPFSTEALALEEGEFARRHTADLGDAWRSYDAAARSEFPIHAALGHLGLGLIEAERGQPAIHIRTAHAIASDIDARLVVAKTDALLRAGDRKQQLHAATETFIP